MKQQRLCSNPCLLHNYCI